MPDYPQVAYVVGRNEVEQGVVLIAGEPDQVYFDPYNLNRTGAVNPGGVRRIKIYGVEEIIEYFATTSDTEAGAGQPGTRRLEISALAGLATLGINVTYNAELDETGYRPYATLRRNLGAGIPADITETAGAGAGQHLLTFSFGPTTIDDVLVFDLTVPESARVTEVTWEPVLTSDTPGAFIKSSSGNGKGNVSVPIRPITAPGSGARGNSMNAGTATSRSTGRKV